MLSTWASLVIYDLLLIDYQLLTTIENLFLITEKMAISKTIFFL